MRSKDFIRIQKFGVWATAEIRLVQVKGSGQGLGCSANGFRETPPEATARNLGDLGAKALVLQSLPAKMQT